MRTNTKVRQMVFPLAILTGMAVLLTLSLPRLNAAQHDQPGQQDQRDQQSKQNQQNQGQSQTEQQPKKKGGFFGGLKAVTTQSSDQNKETASMGTKGVSDGKTIADKTPTAADRQQVTDMENYSVPQPDLKKFQDDGHLQPKK